MQAIQDKTLDELKSAKKALVWESKDAAKRKIANEAALKKIHDETSATTEAEKIDNGKALGITENHLYNSNSDVKVTEQKIKLLEIRKTYGAAILANTYQAH